MVTGIYEAFYRYMRSKRIYVSESLKRELGADTWKELTKEFIGYFTVNKSKGIAIDSLYIEMSSMFPDIVPNDIINQCDQLILTFDAMRLARKDRKGELYKLDAVDCI